MGFRQFRLRGLENVRGEWQLVCLAYNFRRLWKVKTEADRGASAARRARCARRARFWSPRARLTRARPARRPPRGDFSPRGDRRASNSDKLLIRLRDLA